MVIDTAAKKTAIPPNFDTIPPFMQSKTKWVLWKYQKRGGKWTKLPYQPDCSMAKSTASETWSTLDEVKTAYQVGNFDGIGYVLSQDEELFVIDIDGQDVSDLEPKTQSLIANLRTICEISASGRGLHLWLQGDRPDWLKAANKWGTRNRSGEVYFAGRYIAWTGHKHELSSDYISKCDTSKPWFRERWPNPNNGSIKSSKTKSWVEDDVIIQRIQADDRGDNLWRGQWNNYESQSEADLALAGMIAKHGADADQVDRLFRQSGLMREKWDRDDYRTSTIEKALQQKPRRKHERSVLPEYTDMGNAKWMSKDHGDDIRYCFPWGKWLIWDGRRWRPDDRGEISQRAKQTVVNMFLESFDSEDPLAKHAV